MQRLGYIAGLLVGLALIFGTPVIAFFIIRALWQQLTGINPNLAIALVTGATTVVASVVTVMVGRHYERKREIEAHFRAAKLDLYEDFLREFFGVFHNGEKSKDLVPFLQDWDAAWS